MAKTLSSPIQATLQRVVSWARGVRALGSDIGLGQSPIDGEVLMDGLAGVRIAH